MGHFKISNAQKYFCENSMAMLTYRTTIKSFVKKKLNINIKKNYKYVFVCIAFNSINCIKTIS